MSKFKPTIVLAAITTIVALLLVLTHELTYEDTSGVITEKLMAACVEAMGEGDYSIVTDWQEYGIDKPDNVEKMIKKSDGSIGFEIIADGYSKGGIDVLVAMNGDGTVKAVSVVALGETPGLGTKVNDSGFLSQYIGKKGELSVVKKAPSNEQEIEAVTSATYSSKGVTKAVNIAISTYAQLKGVESK